MSMKQQLVSRSVNDLDEVGKGIISFAGNNKIWLFIGEMGAGKTTTIKAICRELGVVDDVRSPTFAIVNEYLTKTNDTVYHFDFYRIEALDEVLDIGIDEYFDSGNVCLLEWPQNIEDLLPEKFVRIDIHENEDQTRTFKLSKYGE